MIYAQFFVNFTGDNLKKAHMEFSFKILEVPGNELKSSEYLEHSGYAGHFLSIKIKMGNILHSNVSTSISPLSK